MLMVYGWSFRIGDKGPPISRLSKYDYDRAPFWARLGMWMVIIGLVGAAITYLLIHAT